MQYFAACTDDVLYFSWQKLLRKARAHVGLSSQLR
jgi:hypothetical protein